MPFHHEKLTVYQRALEFASWSQDLIESLSKRTSTRDQLERAGDSIALNIAEGNGKFSQKDRARFFQIAHGSALDCAAVSIFSWRGVAALMTRLYKAQRFWKRLLGCFSRCWINWVAESQRMRRCTKTKRKR